MSTLRFNYAMNQFMRAFSVTLLRFYLSAECLFTHSTAIPFLPLCLDHPVESGLEYMFHHYGPWAAAKKHHNKIEASGGAGGTALDNKDKPHKD